MAKSLKFTIEVNGLEIPERAQAEISKALNQTLMHKLGELDLAGAKPIDKSQPGAAANGSFLFSKYLINGGYWEKMINQNFTKAVNQLQVDSHIPQGPGEIQVLVH
jgi:hypothetical protein